MAPLIIFEITVFPNNPINKTINEINSNNKHKIISKIVVVKVSVKSR